MDGIWVSGIFGLVGALIGGGLSVLTTWWNRRWQKEDLKEQEARAVRLEVRQRAVGKAEAVLSDLRALEELLSRRIIVSHADVVSTEDRPELGQLISNIVAASVYLTSPTRERVGAVPRLISDAPQLAEQRWVQDSAQVMVRLTVWQARAAVECYLRGEEAPPEDPRVAAYLKAQQDLEDWVEQDIERQIEEAEQRNQPTGET